jgi:hypothetical protein
MVNRVFSRFGSCNMVWWALLLGLTRKGDVMCIRRGCLLIQIVKQAIRRRWGAITVFIDQVIVGLKDLKTFTTANVSTPCR